jgi:hypothetical protein
MPSIPSPTAIAAAYSFFMVPAFLGEISAERKHHSTDGEIFDLPYLFVPADSEFGNVQVTYKDDTTSPVQKIVRENRDA